MATKATKWRVRAAARNALARASRTLPDLRGKATLGAAIGKLLTDEADDDQCILPVEMKRGGDMILDIRSRTEVWTYWTGRYDDDALDRIIEMLPAGATVLDVGANIGFYAVALGKHLATTLGRVFAFEPIPSNYARLKENIRINDLENIVTAYDCALGDTEEIVALNLEQTGGARTGNGVIVKGAVGKILTPTVECLIRPLDVVAEELQIRSCDFIKVDVEGYEYQFLKGAAGFISKTRPVIYGEFNRYWTEQLGASILDVAGILGPIGYQPHCTGAGGDLVPITSLAVGQEDIWWLPR